MTYIANETKLQKYCSNCRTFNMEVTTQFVDTPLAEWDQEISLDVCNVVNFN